MMPTVCHDRLKQFQDDLGIVLSRAELYEYEIRKLREALGAIRTPQLCENIEEARKIARHYFENMKLGW